MEQIAVWIKGISTLIGGFLGWMFGGFDGFLYTLVVFVCIDYITGMIAAAVEKSLNSEVGLKGIARKVSIFFLIALAHLIDYEILGNTKVLRTAVVFFYVSNEGLSILENITRIGVPVPEKLKEVLEQIKTKESKHD